MLHGRGKHKREVAREARNDLEGAASQNAMWQTLAYVHQWPGSTRAHLGAGSDGGWRGQEGCKEGGTLKTALWDAATLSRATEVEVGRGLQALSAMQLGSLPHTLFGTIAEKPPATWTSIIIVTSNEKRWLALVTVHNQGPRRTGLASDIKMSTFPAIFLPWKIQTVFP